MATIATRVFGDGTSTLFTLYNDEFVRTLGWGNGWTKIRVAVLCAIQATGNFTLTTNMGLGICTGNATIGNTLGIKSASTTNWAGIMPNNTAFGTTAATFNAGPPAYIQFGAMALAAKRGGAFASQLNNGVAWFMPTTASGNRGFMIADITKLGATGTVTVGAYAPKAAGTAQVNHNLNDLLEATEQLRDTSSITLKGITTTPINSNTVATDETFGIFDTASLWWNNPATPLEIYAIMVSGSFGAANG